MDSGAMWMRMKAHGWAYTLSILATLSLGILIGTVISYGVKGKKGNGAMYAAHRALATADVERFFADCQAVGTERRKHQHRIDHQECSQAPWTKSR